MTYVTKNSPLLESSFPLYQCPKYLNTNPSSGIRKTQLQTFKHPQCQHGPGEMKNTNDSKLATLHTAQSTAANINQCLDDMRARSEMLGATLRIFCLISCTTQYNESNFTGYGK